VPVCSLAGALVSQTEARVTEILYSSRDISQCNCTRR